MAITGKSARTKIKSKTGFAKLLAAENLSVIHDPSASTAAFDLQERALYLPILKEMTGYMYNAFIAHEVSHALYTPTKEWNALGKKFLEDPDSNLPLGYVNVTEDSRIERLIQERFPGLKQDFRKFYEKLSSDSYDFFGIAGKDLNELDLIDKINLECKIGAFKTIPFTQEEEKFLKKVISSRTFKEAADVAEEIFEYQKKLNKNKPKQSQTNQQGNSPSSSSGQQGNQASPKSGKDNSKGSGDGKGQGQSEKSQQQGDSDQASGGAQTGTQDQSKKAQSNQQSNSNSSGVSTQEAFDNAFETLVEKSKGAAFVEIPELEVYDKVVSKGTLEKAAKYTNANQKPYDQFKTNTKNPVGLMVNQFNMKKSAMDYRKIQESTTGALDMKKLSQYKTSENLFRKSEAVPEEKNHGMIMMVDWSGSMSGNIQQTMAQLFILVEFCKTLSIPFSVYGFTSGISKPAIKKSSAKTFGLSESVNVFEMINSRMSKAEYMNARNFLFEKSSEKRMHDIAYSGYTPLHGTALISERVIDKFREDHPTIEKVNFILLSDGGSTDSMVEPSGEYIGKYGKRIILRDPQTMETEDFVSYGESTWHYLFKIVKKRTDIHSMTGIFISSSICEGVANCVYPDVLDVPKVDVKDAAAKFREKKYFVYPSGIAFDKFMVVDVNNFKLDVKDFLKDSDDEDASEKFLKQVAGNKKSFMFMKFFIDTIS